MTIKRTIELIDKYLPSTQVVTVDLIPIGIADRHNIRSLENHYTKLGYDVDILIGEKTLAIKVAHSGTTKRVKRDGTEQSEVKLKEEQNKWLSHSNKKQEELIKKIENRIYELKETIEEDKITAESTCPLWEKKQARERIKTNKHRLWELELLIEWHSVCE